MSVFRREYNINSYYSLLNSGHEQGKNILYPNLFHLAAVGGVPVWEQEAAAGEQRAQAGAADNQDTARARRPGRQEEEIFFSRWILQLALF